MLRASLLAVLIANILMVRSAPAQELFEVDSMVTLLNSGIHDSVRCRLLFDIAAEVGSSDTATSMSYLEQGKVLAGELEDSEGLGRYYMISGLIHSNLGDYDQALVEYDRALAYFLEANDHLRYYETVKNKGNVYLFTADYTQALNQYNTALDFYRRNNIGIGISRCLNNIGIIHKNRGDYDEALWAYEESIIYLNPEKDAYDISQAYINMGNVFVYLGVYDQALDYFSRALEISQRENFRKNISLCLSNSGVVQNKLGNYREALSLYQDALEVSRELNDQIQISNCLINIGTNYANMGQHEKGIEYLQEGMAIKIELGDDRVISNCYINLAEIYVMMEEYERAIELFNRAIPVKEELGDQEGLVRCYLGLGSIMSERQQYGEARIMVNRALQMADTIRALEHLANGYEIMKEIALARGDYKNAYAYTTVYHQYKDSLMNEAASRAAMEIEFRNRSKALERENENLRVQSDLTSELMRKRNAFFYSVLGFTMLLAAGLVLVIYFLRKLRVTSLKLEEKNLVITKQNLKLNQLNRTKDQMMSIIAHDLRGTIGNQLAAVEVLHSIESEGEKGIDRKKLLGNLKHSASYSLELLENLLLWSRLDEPDSNFRPEEVNMETLIENCTSLFDETASMKKLTIKTIVKGPLQCVVDKIMFETIIRNLLSNAIKFSNPGGSIEIKAERKEKMVHIRITDHGIGINGEQLKKINHKDTFTRRGTADEKGAGIGLILVREFTALHKGNLLIFSKPEEGSTFEVVIPCRN
jgi:signal transduction histidine kinase/Tfp pilus assembly protein PilF